MLAGGSFYTPPLQPYMGEAKSIGVKMAPNLKLAAGTVLALITATAATEVQTYTLSGSPTGGQVRFISSYGKRTDFMTFAQLVTATAADAQATVKAQFEAIYGSGNIASVVRSGTTPNFVFTVTFGGALAGLDVPPLVLEINALSGGSTPSVGIATTTAGVSNGRHATYNDSNSDGTQTARGILKNDIVTDEQGRVILGTALLPENNHYEPEATMYYSGTFLASQLIGLDANGQADLGGRLIKGASLSDSAAILLVPGC